MSKLITKDEAIELLERAVNENGADYIDPRSQSVTGCDYAVGGAPACIVGHVFSYIGIDPNRIETGDVGSVLSTEMWNDGKGTYDRVDTNRLNPSYVDGADFYKPEVEFEEDAVRALSFAQTAQDNGLTWGEALESAKENSR